MNFIGKLMVVLYVAVSIAALMWATIVYTNRVDWAPPLDSADASKGGTSKDGVKEPPAKLQGKVNQSQAEIEKLNDANQRAIKRWTANYLTVNQAEQDRLNRRNFYRGRLDIALTGTLNDAPVEGPLRELKFDEATGLLEIDLELDDSTGKASVGEAFKKAVAIDVRPGIRARAPFAYLPEIDKANKDILATQDRIYALIQQHQRATTIINSEQLEGPFQGIKKGLRQLIKDQVAIEKIAVAEREYLSDFITNRRAEGQLFVKRRDLLQARVEELMRLRPMGDGKLE